MPPAQFRSLRRRSARLAALTGLTASAAALLTVVSAGPAVADPWCNGLNCFDEEKTPGSGGGGGGGGGGDDLPGCGAGPLGDCIVDPGGAPVETTASIAERARASAELPVPRVHTAPDGRTYVKVRTRLWVGGFSNVSTQPINVGARSVQAIATPKNVTWNLGETTRTCTGAGSPGNDSCSHQYQRSSSGQPSGAYQVSATITWSVRWTCAGAGCGGETGGVLADLTATSVPEPLVVDEIQTKTGQ